MRLLKLESLSGLSCEELRERQSSICEIKADAQTSLRNLRKLKDRMDSTAYRVMCLTYRKVILQIDKETDVYNDAIFNSQF